MIEHLVDVNFEVSLTYMSVENSTGEYTMQLGRFDHVNVRTADIERMVAWYERVLGMTNGQRPPFPFPGAWLYVGDHPSVHLVGVTTPPESDGPSSRAFRFSGERD